MIAAAGPAAAAGPLPADRVDWSDRAGQPPAVVALRRVATDGGGDAVIAIVLPTATDRQSIALMLGRLMAIETIPTVSAQAAEVVTTPGGVTGELWRLHRSLDRRRLANTLATDGPGWIGADRVTVLIPAGRSMRVIAATGAERINRRTATVVAAERLAAAVGRTGERLIVPAGPLPPQIEGPLTEWIDQTLAGSAVLQPLFWIPPTAATEPPVQTRPRLIGMLIAERFSGEPLRGDEPIWPPLVAHAAAAMTNVAVHRSTPLWRTSGLVAASFSRRRWLATTAACLAFLLACLAAWSVRVPHWIEAPGTAQPVRRQHVFAAVDGTIDQIHVVDGQTVTAGQRLVGIHSPSLVQQREELAGQIATQSAQWIAATTRRRDGGRTAPGSTPADESELADRGEQLRIELDSLNRQLELVNEQIAAATIHSPIAGVVSGWDLRRQLGDRPVSRGQRLDDDRRPRRRHRGSNRPAGASPDAHRRAFGRGRTARRQSPVGSGDRSGPGCCRSFDEDRVGHPNRCGRSPGAVGDRNPDRRFDRTIRSRRRRSSLDRWGVGALGLGVVGRRRRRDSAPRVAVVWLGKYRDCCPPQPSRCGLIS